MKPLLLVLLLAGLLAVAALASAPDPQPVRAMHPCMQPQVAGDLWGDGAVQSSDAQALLVRVAEAGYDHWCAPLDVDCNGNVTAVDALKILRYVAGMPYTQHEPCPDIGTVMGAPGNSAQFACGSPWFGDVDGNGIVGSPDAMWILRRIAELPLPEGGGGCSSQDVDCDSDRDAVDALKILRRIAAMPYSQREPCPDIATDVDPYCPFGYPWPTTAAGDSGATPTPPVPLVEFCNDTGQAADGLQFWAWTRGYPLHVLNVVSPPGCDPPSVTVSDPPSASLTWPTACVDDGESVSMRIGGCDGVACTGPSVICFRWTAGAPISSSQVSSPDNPC